MRAILALPLLLLAAAAEPTIRIAPPWRDAPEMAPRPGRPHGTLEGFIMASADSRLFPGIRQLDNATTRRRDPHGNRLAAALSSTSEPAPYRREVFVYLPAGTRLGATLPLLVVQDGRDYAARVAAALDGLIAEHRVPPIAAVLIQSGGGDAQGSERGLEYDTLSPRYAEFVEREVLPEAERIAGVRFSADPRDRAAMGGSSGAAAAFTMAWFHPEWFGRVLSYSGTFVNQASPADPATPEGAWDYAARLVPASAPKPIRVWMEVGTRDLHWDDPEGTFHNWPLANDRLAAALRAKGYDVRYVVAEGATHVDGDVTAQTLPDAIAWLWRDRPR